MTLAFARTYWISYLPENAPLFARNLPELGLAPVTQVRGVRAEQFKLLPEWGTPREMGQWLTHRYLWRTLALLQINALVLEDTHLVKPGFADLMESTAEQNPSWQLMLLGSGAYALRASAAAKLDRLTSARKGPYEEHLRGFIQYGGVWQLELVERTKPVL